MADPRRWQSPGVKREDQFVRPPAFRDENDSKQLSPGSASWHGSGSRHVALATGLAIAAGIAAVAFMLLVAPSGEVGTQVPLGAEGESDPGVVEVGDVDVPPSSAAGNGTTGIPLPGAPLP